MQDVPIIVDMTAIYVHKCLNETGEFCNGNHSYRRRYRGA